MTNARMKISMAYLLGLLKSIVTITEGKWLKNRLTVFYMEINEEFAPRRGRHLSGEKFFSVTSCYAE
jgi:hypothetical protein